MAADASAIHGRLVVTGIIEAVPGKAEDVLAILKECIAVSKREADTLTYRVSRAGNKFLMFEEYTNAAAFQTHMTNPALGILLTRLVEGEMLTSPPEVHGYWEEIGVADTNACKDSSSWLSSLFDYMTRDDGAFHEYDTYTHSARPACHTALSLGDLCEDAGLALNL